MSMMEALRHVKDDFLSRNDEAKSDKRPDVVDEYAHLVALANMKGAIDRQSGTWAAVAAWAAREILTARAKLDGAGTQAEALRERIRSMKDLLSIDAQQAKKRIAVKGHEPEIP